MRSTAAAPLAPLGSTIASGREVERSKRRDGTVVLGRVQGILRVVLVAGLNGLLGLNRLAGLTGFPGSKRFAGLKGLSGQ